MERSVDEILSDEISELLPAMMKLDNDENNKKERKKLLGVNKSSSIAKKKKTPRPELKRNAWAVDLPIEKKMEMRMIEDELQGGRDYIGVSRAASVMVSGQKKKRYSAEITDPHGRRVVIGTNFRAAKSAALAHDEVALKMYGLAIRLNFPHRVTRNNTSTSNSTNTSIDENKGNKVYGNCETMISAS